MLTFGLSMIPDESDKLNFERMYETYADDVLKRIMRLLRNRQDAEDVSQETWLAIAKRIVFFREKNEKSVKSYILKIARNRAITSYHKRKKTEEICLENIYYHEGNTYSDEASLIEFCEMNDISRIADCIASLDEIYSDALNMYYFHHHTIKEISYLLNVKESTMRNRIVRGRGKLIQLLSEKEY